jgi:hypothetical protein
LNHYLKRSDHFLVTLKFLHTVSVSSSDSLVISFRCMFYKWDQLYMYTCYLEIIKWTKILDQENKQVLTRKVKGKLKPCDLDLWPWKSIGFQILLKSKYVPSLVKIHWRMLILECSQGCYAVQIWPGDIDLWPMTLKINRNLVHI